MKKINTILLRTFSIILLMGNSYSLIIGQNKPTIIKEDWKDLEFIDWNLIFNSEHDTSIILQKLIYGDIPSIAQSIEKTNQLSSEIRRVYCSPLTIKNLQSITIENNIEIIFLQIQDLSELIEVIDLSFLKKFNHLKCLYISFSTPPCLNDEFNQICIQKYLNQHFKTDENLVIQLIYNIATNE
jgi:hypothetical protein